MLDDVFHSDPDEGLTRVEAEREKHDEPCPICLDWPMFNGVVDDHHSVKCPMCGRR